MRVRLFVDGPPTDWMLLIRAADMQAMDPASEGRWPNTISGRAALAEAAFEAGWDSAVIEGMKLTERS